MAAEGDVTVMMRLCVSGGGLGKETWVPSELRIVDGVTLLPLRSSDRQLAKFCGKNMSGSAPLAYNDFMTRLRDWRNDAVDNALLEHLQSKDPLGQLKKLPKGARQSVDPSELPGTVTIQLPAVRADIEMADGTTVALSAPQMDVKVGVDFATVSVVWIACTKEALHYVRVAVVGARTSDKKRQRMITSEMPAGFRVDKRRLVVRTARKHPHNPGITMYLKAKVQGEWTNASVNQAAEELLETVTRFDEDPVAFVGHDADIEEVEDEEQGGDGDVAHAHAEMDAAADAQMDASADAPEGQVAADAQMDAQRAQSSEYS